MRLQKNTAVSVGRTDVQQTSSQDITVIYIKSIAVHLK